MQATGPKISSCFGKIILIQNEIGLILMMLMFFSDTDADVDADEPAYILSCLADQRSELVW